MFIELSSKFGVLCIGFTTQKQVTEKDQADGMKVNKTYHLKHCNEISGVSSIVFTQICCLNCNLKVYVSTFPCFLLQC